MSRAGRRRTATPREQLAACWTIFRLVSVRQLTLRRRRTLLTLLGIAASVSLVIAITLVNATVRATVEDTATGLAGTAQLQVRPFGQRALAPRDAAAARRVPGVAAAVPTTQQITRMQHGVLAVRALVAGVPPRVTELFPDGFGAATAAVTRPAPGTVVLAPHLAEQLGARQGDRVTVSTPRGAARLTVAALLPRSPLSSVNGGQLALAGLAQTQRTFDVPGEVGFVYVKAAEGRSVAALQAALRRAVSPAAKVGDPAASAQPYTHTFDGIAASTQQVRGIALVLALFLVLNTMGMALAERRSDIALLATGGAQRAQVVAAFVAEAAIVGAAGGVLGTAVGFGLAHVLIGQAEDVYQSVLPITAAGAVRLTARQALLGVGSGALVAMAGAAIVARRILRMTPIDALAPAPPYAASPAGRELRRARRLALGGLATTACAVPLVALAPVGSHPALLGLALLLTLAGAVLLLPFLVGALTSAGRRAWPRLFGLRGRLAADGLVRVPGRTTIAAGALGLTIALVVASASGLGSFRREVNRAATTWFELPLYVRANGEGLLAADQPLPVALRRRLARVEGVRAAYPMRVALLERRGTQLGVLAWPIAEAARHGDQVTGDVPIDDPELLAAMRRGDVVASRLTARRRGLHVGDVVRLPVAGAERSFRVAELFNDLASTDAAYIEHDAYVKLSGDRKVDRFALALDPGADRDAVAARVQRFLDAHGLPGTVVTNVQMERYVLDLVEGVFSLAAGAQLAALLIAAFVVLNTMLTVTFERRRELGLQRMLGMTGRQQSGAVVLEAVAMSAVGAALAVLLGLVLGALMTVGIENQLAWHVTFHPAVGATLAAALVGVAVGAAAACYPSWLATRPPLVELLRAE
jgi:putative ABC transport system permease protein